MKITVLGSGGFAYPLVFCECNYCKQARILGGKNIRKRASLLINDEMIIDMTSDCQTAMNMYGKDMSKAKYLLQTHTHLDHFDINHFTSLDLKYCTVRKTPINLIASKLGLNDIHAKANQFDRMDLVNPEYLEKINLKTHELNHGESLEIANYSIKAIHCTHDEKLGAQNYLIKQNGKTLLYATDTPPITDIALNELYGEKIDCLFLDESFGTQEYMITHLNLQGFRAYVEKLKENNLLSENCLVYATHMTHDGNPLHDELEGLLNEFGCHASYDGLEFDL